MLPETLLTNILGRTAIAIDLATAPEANSAACMKGDWPEIVTPLSNTVGFIHTHEGQGHEGGEGLQQHPTVQPLGRHIQHPQPACLQNKSLFRVSSGA